MTPRENLRQHKELAAFFFRKAVWAQMEVYRFLRRVQDLSGTTDDLLDHIEQMAADFRDERQIDEISTEKCVRVIEGALNQPDQDLAATSASP